MFIIFKKYFRVAPAFSFANSTNHLADMDHHNVAPTNMLVWKVHWHISGYVCQVPYSRYYPLWFFLVPGFFVTYAYHFNKYQRAQPSNLFSVITILLGIGCTFLEDAIRTYGAQLGIGTISFPVLTIYTLLYFRTKGRQVLRDYVKGIDLYVEQDSRSFVSSGEFSFLSISV